MVLNVVVVVVVVAVVLTFVVVLVVVAEVGFSVAVVVSMVVASEVEVLCSMSGAVIAVSSAQADRERTTNSTNKNPINFLILILL